MNNEPTIRVALIKDAVALSELAILSYTTAFGHSFSQSDLEAHLNKRLSPDSFRRILDDDVVLVADLESRLVGYVQFGTAKSLSTHEDDRELRRLYVHPEFQYNGYGSALMGAALAHPGMAGAPTIYLDVWEHNTGAQRLYRRYGFEVVGTREFEVDSGAETSLDLVMARVASETRA